MSNLSNAYGRMTLKGAWTPELVEKFNAISRGMWGQFYYCIDIVPFVVNEDTLSSPFFGHGKWTFTNSLEHLGLWTKGKSEKNSVFITIHRDLIKKMQADGLIVEVEFTDEERSFSVHYTETGVLSSNGEMLVYTVLTENDHLIEKTISTMQRCE